MRMSSTHNVVVLVEPFYGGHHNLYLRQYVKIFLELHYDVWILCTHTNELRLWLNKNCHAYRFNYRIWNFPLSAYSSMFDKFLYWKWIRWLRTITSWVITSVYIGIMKNKYKKNPVLVFYMWIDTFLSKNISPACIDAIFPYSWTGLYFQPDYMRVLKYGNCMQPQHDELFHASGCKGIIIFDKKVAPLFKRKFQDKPIYVFPEYIFTKLPKNQFSLAGEIRTKAKNRLIIGLFGSLERRKELILLMETARAMRNKNWFFIFCGEIFSASFTTKENEYIHAFAASRPNNCFFYFKRIPDEKNFNAVINTSDIIYAVYKDFPPMSNFIGKASYFKKPIIVDAKYCMGELTKEYHLGISITHHTVEECIKGLGVLEQRIKKKCSMSYMRLYYKENTETFLKQQIRHVMEELA